MKTTSGRRFSLKLNNCLLVKLWNWLVSDVMVFGNDDFRDGSLLLLLACWVRRYCYEFGNFCHYC